jgi:endonuclease/exonuclease/phosphatase family metal-dependent hydrolase
VEFQLARIRTILFSTTAAKTQIIKEIGSVGTIDCCAVFFCKFIRWIFTSVALVSAVSTAATGHASQHDVEAADCSGSSSASLLTKPTLKILSLNLAHGRGSARSQLLVNRDTTYRNLDEIAMLIVENEPDLVALQEADAPSRWSGNFDHVRYLSEAAGYAHFVHGLHAHNWLYTFGTALLSDSVFAASSHHNFRPSPPTTNKGMVIGSVCWQTSQGLRLLTTLSVHMDFSRRSIRESQLEEVLLALREISGPVVVAGDFNAQWLKEDTVIRAFANRSGMMVFEPDSPTLGTYKSSRGKRLDWILITRDLEFIAYETLPDVLSDHLVVAAEIGYRGGE